MPTIDYPVQIALLDDHPLFRQGLRYILESFSFVESVVDADEFPRLQEICRLRLPDILLLDMQMPGIDGAEAAKLLLSEFPDLKIIVLSMFSADNFIVQMIKLGARSYLPKDVDQEQLRQALEDVLTTGQHFTSRISRALVRGVQQPTRQSGAALASQVQLTRREQEVLGMICKGCSTTEIADHLFISPRTVEGHRQNLLEKTNSANSTALVVYAVQHNLNRA